MIKHVFLSIYFRKSINFAVQGKIVILTQVIVANKILKLCFYQFLFNDKIKQNNSFYIIKQNQIVLKSKIQQQFSPISIILLIKMRIFSLWIRKLRYLITISNNLHISKNSISMLKNSKKLIIGERKMSTSMSLHKIDQSIRNQEFKKEYIEKVEKKAHFCNTINVQKLIHNREHEKTKRIILQLNKSKENSQFIEKGPKQQIEAYLHKIIKIQEKSSGYRAILKDKIINILLQDINYEEILKLYENCRRIEKQNYEENIETSLKISNFSHPNVSNHKKTAKLQIHSALYIEIPPIQQKRASKSFTIHQSTIEFDEISQRKKEEIEEMDIKLNEMKKKMIDDLRLVKELQQTKNQLKHIYEEDEIQSVLTKQISKHISMVAEKEQKYVKSLDKQMENAVVLKKQCSSDSIYSVNLKIQKALFDLENSEIKQPKYHQIIGNFVLEIIKSYEDIFFAISETAIQINEIENQKKQWTQLKQNKLKLIVKINKEYQKYYFKANQVFKKYKKPDRQKKRGATTFSSMKNVQNFRTKVKSTKELINLNKPREPSLPKSIQPALQSQLIVLKTDIRELQQTFEGLKKITFLIMSLVQKKQH